MTPRQISESTKKLLKEAIYFRGEIITGYAQVEFILADFAVKCPRLFPEYESLWASFPYRLEARIKAVQKLICGPGPLFGYREELAPLVERILRYESDGHFLAHGVLQVDARIKPPRLTFSMYEPRSKELLELNHRHATLDELRAYADEITEYAQATVTLFRKIYLEQHIERAESASRLAGE
jgi:hypothetical protein